MIHGDASDTELLRVARLAGMKLLLDDAMVKVKSGATTCEEILRVLGPQTTFEIICSGCGAHLEERYQYCPFCGDPLSPSCTACGHFLMNEWNVCPSCAESTRQDL